MSTTAASHPPETTDHGNETQHRFVHGIWADGSSFSKLMPPLQRDGYEVIAAQYGLDTVAEDVAAVKRTLGRVGSPAILVASQGLESFLSRSGPATPRAGGVWRWHAGALSAFRQ